MERHGNTQNGAQTRVPVVQILGMPTSGKAWHLFFPWTVKTGGAGGKAWGWEWGQPLGHGTAVCLKPGNNQHTARCVRCSWSCSSGTQGLGSGYPAPRPSCVQENRARVAHGKGVGARPSARDGGRATATAGARTRVGNTFRGAWRRSITSGRTRALRIPGVYSK